MLLWIFAALSIGLIAAFTARAKGRPFKPWLAYGTLLGVVALPHALLLRDDDGPDDDDGREADGLFGFNLATGRRDYPFPDREEWFGWEAGELPPEGLVMRAPEPGVETEVAPVWSEDDFARIAGAGTAGDGRTRRARTTPEEGRDSGDASFGAREAAPPVPGTGTAPDEPSIDTTGPREGFSQTTRDGGRSLPPDQDISPEAASMEPEHADDEAPVRAAASSVDSEAARSAQAASPADIEPGDDDEPLFDSEPPPPPPPESPDSDLGIPPPPAFEYREGTRKAFRHPRRRRRSGLYDGGAPSPGDDRQEPHFGIGRDDANDFDGGEAARMARRFAPHHGVDDAHRVVYEDRPERRHGLLSVVAAACVLLVVFVAWSRFVGLWAPRETDTTPSATMQQAPDVDASGHVSSVPVVPPNPPGKDTDVTASIRGDMRDVPPAAGRESVNRTPPALNDEVPKPPPVPAARARLEASAKSSSANVRGMEAMRQPPRKPASPVASSGGRTGHIQEDKGEISATGDMVARIQAALRKRGYDIDTVDGRAGTKTREAIAAFKRDQGLSATTMIDDALIERLGIAGRRLYPFTPPGRRAAQ